MVRPRRENVLAVYHSEADAVKHAIMLARELAAIVGVMYRLIDGAEVYQLVRQGYEEEGWQRIGSAYPTGRYHGQGAAQ